MVVCANYQASFTQGYGEDIVYKTNIYIYIYNKRRCLEGDSSMFKKPSNLHLHYCNSNFGLCPQPTHNVNIGS